MHFQHNTRWKSEAPQRSCIPVKDANAINVFNVVSIWRMHLRECKWINRVLLPCTVKCPPKTKRRLLINCSCIKLMFYGSCRGNQLTSQVQRLFHFKILKPSGDWAEGCAGYMWPMFLSFPISQNFSIPCQYSTSIALTSQVCMAAMLDYWC